MSHHVSSNGQYLGEVSKKLHYRNNGDTVPSSSSFSSTVREQHFSSVTGESMAQHVVRRGDSLRTLAQVYYGNADYWYLIANANGLAAEAESGLLLTDGMTLDIPARASSFNSHNNFKPADLAKIIGDTTPTVPYIPPPPKKGCNAVAMVVMIAITAVAAVATAGAAAAAMGGGAFSMSLGASAMMGGATIGAGTVAATTVAAGTLGSVLATSAVAAAAGGFVGSVAGQLAGKAMGVVDSFSLKNAFASGLTAGATAGLGGALNSTSWATEAGKLDVYGKMAMAASSVGINVAANKLAGNRASFQWRNVVSSAVTAGLMARAQLHNITDPLERFSQSGGFLTDFTNGLAGAAIGYGVSKGLYNEGSWNFKNVAQDAFGNAVGNSIVRNRIEAQLEREKVQAGVAAFLKQKADLIDQQTGALVSAEASKAAGKVLDAVTTENAARFEAMSDALERSNDAMMDQYRNKRAEAAAGLAAMSDKTRGDIAAFDLLVLAGRRRRQEQQSVTAAYYGRKALDFRVENPVYKGSATLLTSQQIQRAQGLIRHDGAVMEMTRRQGELDKVTQELYRAYYGKPGLLLNSEGYTQFSKLNAEIGLAKGALGLGYDAIKNSGIELAYGNLNSMTPKGFLGNALPNDPNFRTLTWGFGMASDVKGQPLFSLSSQALTQPVDIALDTPWARIGNGALTYAGPIVGTIGIVDMLSQDLANPAYNPTGWDYFSVSSKNAVDWGMARLGGTGPVGGLVSLAYTAVDYKLSSFEYRPTRPLDGIFDKRTGWHGFGYSLSDSYLNNIEANQRILGPNWKMHGKN